MGGERPTERDTKKEETDGKDMEVFAVALSDVGGTGGMHPGDGANQ